MQARSTEPSGGNAGWERTVPGRRTGDAGKCGTWVDLTHILSEHETGLPGEAGTVLRPGRACSGPQRTVREAATKLIQRKRTKPPGSASFSLCLSFPLPAPRGGVGTPFLAWAAPKASSPGSLWVRNETFLNGKSARDIPLPQCFPWSTGQDSCPQWARPPAPRCSAHGPQGAFRCPPSIPAGRRPSFLQ